MITEEEARARLEAHVPRGTFEKLERYAALLAEQATAQNLIASSTLSSLWTRHILDSSQLLDLAPAEGLWTDMGSGAGLPGIVVAIISDRPVCLIEPRTKRAAFLADVAADLALGGRVEVVRSRVETAPMRAAAVISARAVAPLVDLFAMGARHATRETIWVLPKGRTAIGEVALAETSWHAQLRLVPSVTDSDASIVVASNVSPRSKRS